MQVRHIQPTAFLLGRWELKWQSISIIYLLGLRIELTFDAKRPGQLCIERHCAGCGKERVSMISEEIALLYL